MMVASPSFASTRSAPLPKLPPQQEATAMMGVAEHTTTTPAKTQKHEPTKGLTLEQRNVRQQLARHAEQPAAEKPDPSAFDPGTAEIKDGETTPPAKSPSKSKATKTESTPSKTSPSKTATKKTATPKTATKPEATKPAPAQPTPPQPQKVTVNRYQHPNVLIETQPLTLDSRKLRNRFYAVEIRLTNEAPDQIELLDAHVFPSYSGMTAAEMDRTPNYKTLDSLVEDFKPETGVKAISEEVSLLDKDQTATPKGLNDFANQFSPNKLPPNTVASTHSLIPRSIDQALLRVTYRDKASDTIRFIEQPLSVQESTPQPSGSNTSNGHE
ncbi:MAG: hypothetical protein R2857_06540 [Vampirovibrionales bacterium]